MKIHTKTVQLETEINQSINFYHSVVGLCKVLNQQTDYEEILKIIGLHVRRLFHADYSSIIMINPKTLETTKTVIKGGIDSELKDFHLLQKNITGWMLKNNKPFLSNDIRVDFRFRSSLFKNSQYGSIVSELINSGMQRIGHILLLNQHGSSVFTPGDLELLKKLTFIITPYLNNTLQISRYFKERVPDKVLLSKYEKYNLYGRSRAFIELLRSVESAASCDVRVLLEGASGSGKELVARAIHGLSNRHDQPFITIDCGAIQPSLIESELFGHLKGAFTGAASTRTGLIAEADKGTLFIDEIHNLPYDLQAKLLRFLQENEIRQVGSNKPQKVDVRIIAATSSQLSEQIKNRKFREDLFYRLHVFPIQIPSLCERREDIPFLASSFLKTFSYQQNKKLEAIQPALINYMKFKKWDGNVRELENFMERLVTLAPADALILDCSYLPTDEQKAIKKSNTTMDDFSVNKSLQEYVEGCEITFIQNALINNKWNQSKTARQLNISEGALRYKMEKLNIIKPATVVT
jgi:transcriptional regulator with GAF, ATPase, and Fis domain